MKKFIINAYYILLPIILGSLVGFLIKDYMDYQMLLKPPLSPPKIVFPIAWSIIYLLMGLAYFFYKRNSFKKF